MIDGLVSVIIPAYNRAHCVSRAIDSALEQTYRPVEVVVIDDGSTDGSAELIRESYSGDERVRYVYQTNRGVSAARNRGIAEARGEFVGFLDSDDVWKPWKVELQVACLRFLPEAGMIWSDMEAVDPAGNVFEPKYLRTMYSTYGYFGEGPIFARSFPISEVVPAMGSIAGGGALLAGDIFSKIVLGNLVHTSTVLLRRERLDKVGHFHEGYRTGEDFDFHLRTCREGPVAFVDVATIRYQCGMADQLSRPNVEIAQNFLDTITRAIRRDADRITLPRRLLNRALADAHAWVGELRLGAGEARLARGHLARSLGYRPGQPRTLALLAASCLPTSAGRTGRRVYRWLKGQTGVIVRKPA